MKVENLCHVTCLVAITNYNHCIFMQIIRRRYYAHSTAFHAYTRYHARLKTGPCIGPCRLPHMGQTQTHLGTHSNHRAVHRVRYAKTTSFKICNNFSFQVMELVKSTFLEERIGSPACTCGLVDVTWRCFPVGRRYSFTSLWSDLFRGCTYITQ